MLLEEFRDPPAEYGSVGMWWWDMGYLTEDRIKNQIHEMSLRGIGTSCIMSHYGPGQRYSTEPEYFSEPWWVCIKYSLEEQKKIGMKQWFCDWLGRCDKQYWQNKLRAEENPALKGRRLIVYEEGVSSDEEVLVNQEVLDQAAYTKSDDRVDYGSRTVASDADGVTWRTITISSEEFDLDYLNKDMVNCWIELHFGAYEDKVAEHLGDTLTGYMPDERTVLTGNVLYSDKLLDRFKLEKGYDPLPYLIGLFYDIGDMTDKIRCDYYDVMVTLLEENFYKPIADWLHDHGMLYTYHAMWGKESMLGQTRVYADFFRMARHFDVPGSEDVRMHDGHGRCFRDSKLASSIAHIYGKKRVMGESSWNSGWNMAPAHNLAWINENYAYGVNCYVQLGAFYGLPGGWFTVPSSSSHEPCLREWKRMGDYVRRLSYIMSQGVHVADVAFLYPITTLHANWIAGDTFTDLGNETADVSFGLAESIYESGIDLDFIDYQSLCDAEISDGKLKVAGMEFRAIVLPPMTTIRVETLRKIMEFAESGGVVVGYGRLPTGSPEVGRDDCNVQSFVNTIFNSSNGFFIPDGYENVSKVISGAIVRDVVVSEPDVFHTHQKIDDVDVYFLYNARSEERQLSVIFRTIGSPRIWDAFTGDVKPVAFQQQKNGTRVRLQMQPDEGIVVVFGSGH